MWKEPASAGQTSGTESTTAKAHLERALTYSPHRGDVWLLLAMFAERFRWSGARPEALQKMSFYAAPNETSLLPQRVVLWGRLEDVGDPDTRDMIRSDVQALVARGANPRADLARALRMALPRNRPLLETAIKQVNPQMAEALRAETR